MPLYVDYKKPIGYVKYHYKDDKDIKRIAYCGIYQCNAYFAIVYKRHQLIMFAVDNKHFAKCVKDKIFKNFTNWNLSCDNSISRGMMLVLTKENIVVRYANQKTIEKGLKTYCE